jgi:hypothetical protein
MIKREQIDTFFKRNKNRRQSWEKKGGAGPVTDIVVIGESWLY